MAALAGGARLYQRDYLMRQIEIAGQMLARILGLAKGGRRDEALGLFDQAYQPLLGVSARVVSTLSEEQLLGLLTSGSSGRRRWQKAIASSTGPGSSGASSISSNRASSASA